MIKYGILLILLVTFIVWCCYKLLTQLQKLQQSKNLEKRYQAHLDYVLSLQGSQVQGEGVKDMQLGVLFKKNPAYRAASSSLLDIKKQIHSLNEALVLLKERELDFQAENEELRQVNQKLLQEEQRRSSDS